MGRSEEDFNLGRRDKKEIEGILKKEGEEGSKNNLEGGGAKKFFCPKRAF